MLRWIKPGSCLLAIALLGAGPFASNYAIDGIVLGSQISNYIAAKGPAQQTNGPKSTWIDGSKTIALSAESGSITEIDITESGNDLVRIDLPARSPQQFLNFNHSVFVNYDPPEGAIENKLCDTLGLVGKPCRSYQLPGNAQLVLNFAHTHNGVMDGALSEVILTRPPL